MYTQAHAFSPVLFHRFDSNGAFIAFEGIKNWCILLKLRWWGCECFVWKPHSPFFSLCPSPDILWPLALDSFLIMPWRQMPCPHSLPLLRACLMQRHSKLRISLPKNTSLSASDSRGNGECQGLFQLIGRCSPYKIPVIMVVLIFLFDLLIRLLVLMSLHYR